MHALAFLIELVALNGRSQADGASGARRPPGTDAASQAPCWSRLRSSGRRSRWSPSCAPPATTPRARGPWRSSSCSRPRSRRAERSARAAGLAAARAGSRASCFRPTAPRSIARPARRFPFTPDQVQAAHAQWTADWLAWERAHDAEYKLKAAAAEQELAAAGRIAGRCAAGSTPIEREKLDLVSAPICRVRPRRESASSAVVTLRYSGTGCPETTHSC